MAWDRSNEETPELIGGDRRNDRRYGLQLDVKWKLIRRRRVLETGTGHTIDLSSGGLMFDAGRRLPEGLNVELSITWPVLLHDVAPLQLVVSGRIVRTDGQRIGVRAVQHEFRTMGVPADQRKPAAGAQRTPPVLANPTNFIGLGKMH
jgi:hypothetical protein